MTDDKTQRWYDKEYTATSSIELRRYKRNIAISKYELDENIQEQPVLLDSVSDLTALASSIKDQAKDELDTTLNEKAQHYRNSLSSSGKSKPTDKSIYELVYTDKLYRIKLRRFNVCRLMANRWSALKSSYEQRSSMLKTLAQLYSANYFTTGSVKSADRVATDAKAQSNRRKINSKRREMR